MQPVVIEDNISVAAATVNDNVIVSNTSLRRYLRCPFNCVAKLVAVTSAVGLRISMDYGSKNVVADSDVRVGTDIQEPLDLLTDNFYPEEGAQLVLRASNTTGGAISLRYRIVLTPVDELQPDCRVMQRFQSIAASGLDVQLLAGLRYERAPVDSEMALFMTASATGSTRQVYIDTESIAPPSSLAPLNRMPQDPFDQHVNGIEVPQDKQIEISVTNPTGGAITVFWKLKLQELIRT